MTTPPTVRVVRVRLDGADDDAGEVAEVLARLLPELSGGRVQAGQVSPPYANRRGRPGARRYFDLYLLDGQEASGAEEDHRPAALGRRAIPGGRP